MRITFPAAAAAVMAHSAAAVTVDVYQSHFDSGTYRISSPGEYVLREDITFCPMDVSTGPSPSEPELWGFPGEAFLSSSTAFRLGFFAAIAVGADDVTIDLNGHTLAQCPEHALMQRFFALIETANSPFPSGAGPADFISSTNFKGANNLAIQDGTLGLSSHHGIHGNRNTGLVIRGLEITNFEVAGISLNTPSDLTIEHVNVHHTRSDVPANGRFSNAVFLLQGVSTRLEAPDPLVVHPDTYAAWTAIADPQADLRAAVYNFLTTGADVDGLFASHTNGHPDASMVAGVIIHPKVNVGSFTHSFPETTNANDVRIRRLEIHDLTGSPGEIGALFSVGSDSSEVDAYGTGGAVTDFAGAVFDVDFATDVETRAYKPNALAELQRAVARYALACKTNADCPTANVELLNRNTISEQVLWWMDGFSSSGAAFAWTDLQETHFVEGNHDVMFHMNKGVVGLKIDGAADVVFKDVEVHDLSNVADASRRSRLAMEYDSVYQYTGYETRGVAISSCEEVKGVSTAVSGLSSSLVDPRCVDIMHDFDRVRIGMTSEQ
jgi:hypothetical protein